LSNNKQKSEIDIRVVEPICKYITIMVKYIKIGLFGVKPAKKGTGCWFYDKIITVPIKERRISP